MAMVQAITATTMGKIEKSFYLISMIICLLLLTQIQAASLNATADIDAEDRSFKSGEIETGRTFGTIKRFQTALLPIMYKLGVMSAVIFMTLFLAFKGVFIGTLILVLNLTFFAIKFGSYLKSDHHHGWQPPSHGWAPPTINHGNGWPPHKDVHLHIHNAHGKPDLTIPYSTLSNGWDTHSNAIEPAWSTSGYGHSGRALIDDIPTAISHPSHPGSAEKFAPIIKARFIEKRHDKPPTIVMAENQQIVTPYNYLNKQNQNQK